MILPSRNPTRLKKHKKISSKYPTKIFKCNQSLNDAQLVYQMNYPNKSIVSNNITPSITFPMRAILIDWLMQASCEFQFQRVTFQRALSIVDKYLSLKDIQKEKFQLLGVTALFISHKLEQVEILQIKMFEDVTNGGFSEQQILNTEEDIYLQLKWKISTPMAYYSLNDTLINWNQHVESTDYQYTKYQHPLNNHMNVIINMLDYVRFHLNQPQSKTLIFALLYNHLTLIQSIFPLSTLQRIYNLFLQKYKLSFKQVKIQIQYIRSFIFEIQPFQTLTKHPNMQQYSSYLNKYSQYINK